MFTCCKKASIETALRLTNSAISMGEAHPKLRPPPAAHASSKMASILIIFKQFNVTALIDVIELLIAL